MTKHIDLEGMAVEHRINTRMRHTYIVVDDDARVILKSPGISSREAIRILKEREGWIHKRLAQQRQKEDLSFIMGQEIRYLGTLYRVTDEAMFSDLDRCIQRARPSLADDPLSRCYDRYYRARAIEHLTRRLHHHEIRTGLRSTELRFRKMRSRWGSCSSEGVITLNTRLMLLPQYLIDHVIVHELVHLRHMDHSPAFYEELQRHHPDHRDLQREIRNIRLS